MNYAKRTIVIFVLLTMVIFIISIGYLVELHYNSKKKAELEKNTITKICEQNEKLLFISVLVQREMDNRRFI